MKRLLFLICLAFVLHSGAGAQCSVCTKSAQDRGEQAAHGLNLSIVYLALLPLSILGTLGFVYWKRNRPL